MTARASTTRPRGERVVLDRKGLAFAISRMAKAIHADQKAANSIAIVGIQSRGVPLAARLARALRTRGKKTIDVGSLDITLYRDDLSTVGTRPVLKATNIPFSIDGRPVLLSTTSSTPVAQSAPHSTSLSTSAGLHGLLCP